MKPIIAIVTLYDEKLESYWMLPGYAQGLEEAGAAPEAQVDGPAPVAVADAAAADQAGHPDHNESGAAHE